MPDILQVIERNKVTGAIRFNWYSTRADGSGADPVALQDLPQWALDQCCGCSVQDPVTEENYDIDIINTTGEFNIPAGAHMVTIKNAGATNVDGMPATATVNGKSMQVGQDTTLKAEYDPATRTYKKVPAIVGNGNGSMVWIIVAR
ncbi:MAG: hypothetical protein AAFO94_07160 [Bacteroidota bacterium]